MAELYTIHDELPPDIADVVIDDNIPVGPEDDPDTATADESDA
jgi:hypothetical protein